jgi:hypothetical protein
VSIEENASLVGKGFDDILDFWPAAVTQLWSCPWIDGAPGRVQVIGQAISRAQG